jgi:hypothetical protein
MARSEQFLGAFEVANSALSRANLEEVAAINAWNEYFKDLASIVKDDRCAQQSDLGKLMSKEGLLR